MRNHTNESWTVDIDKSGFGNWTWNIRTSKPHSPAGGPGAHIGTANKNLHDVERVSMLLAAAPSLLSTCESLVRCLESHINDEARQLGCTPDELCPCKGHELKLARELVASLRQ